jgi:phosphate transport system substrate-binding protein
MTQRKDTLILILTLIVTGSILGGGYWFLTRSSRLNLSNLSPQNQTTTTTPTPSTPIFQNPQTVPTGTTISLDGSTSMVQVNQALKNAFEKQFLGTVVNTNAQGSDYGIKELLANTIDIAAISRPLTENERQQGLIAIPVTQDAIAIVVGVNNSWRRSLTRNQVVSIFEGKIDNWSQLGGENQQIRVINRPEVSGTRQIFQQLVLNGGNFGNRANFLTMSRDATTPILRALGTDGISYATYIQVINQQTIRLVAVEGLTPEAASYPYRRNLYYAYKNPPSPSAQAFLGFVTSPTGRQIIEKAQLTINN